MSIGSTIAKLVHWDSLAPAPSDTYRAPADMTDHSRVREMVRWGEAALEAGHTRLVVDLSRSSSVDSALLAGLVLLTRRAKPLGATLKVVGASERLESLMRLYRLMSALEQSGVVFE